jgi:hypothetical protein
VEVPLGEVDPGVAQDGVGEAGRDAVEPPLVAVHPGGLGAQGVQTTASRPPVQERPALRADGEEAAVVAAEPQHVDLARAEAVDRQRLQEVGRQDGAVHRRELGDALQAGVDVEVRIDVHDDVLAIPEQVAQQLGLEDPRQLGRVVDAPQHRKLAGRDPEIGGDEDVEAVLPEPRLRVGHEHVERQAGVLRPPRRGQHPRVREVVAGDDRAGADHRFSVRMTASGFS